MGSECSDQMIELLREMSILKQLESEYADGSKDLKEAAEHQSRQRRLEEIVQQMHNVAESKKNPAPVG
jgi:hypothetical protein